MAVQRLLQTQTALLLSAEGRESLQYLLAPILCKSRQQQKQFYAIYQTYLAQDLQETPVKTAKIPTADKQSKYIWSLLLLGFLGLLFLLWKNTTTSTVISPKIQFERINHQVHIGDSLHFQNISTGYDHQIVIFEWHLIDEKSKAIEQKISSKHFDLILSTTIKEYTKKIQLIGKDSLTGKVIGSDVMPLSIYCKSPPEITAITVDDSLLTPAQPLPFSANVIGQSLAYEWDFGDKTKAFIPNPIHAYDKTGNYLVQLTVKDTTQKFGKCAHSLQTYVNIEAPTPEEIIASSPFELKKDPPKTVYQSKAWAYILLLILLTTAGWSWINWFFRPLLESPPVNDFKSINTKALKPLAELIQPTFLQFEIANLLRKRHPSRRREMALAKTVNTTVEKGGYSELHFKYKTQPTQYLVLVDLSTTTKYQAALQTYLPTFFEKQDVLIHTFFYKTDLQTIHNKQFPNGLAFKRLYELYPLHRLLILGDVQPLVDTHLQEKQIPKFWQQLIDLWPNHAICTATPISAKIHTSLSTEQNCAIFSNDLAGILAAVKHLEEQANETREEWQETPSLRYPKQLESNTTGTNFEELSKSNFPSNYPEIWRWFKALVVYPGATLSTAVAIGKALKVPPTYDNLQQLSQISGLQKENFDSHVWLNIWQDLPKAEEQTARQAVITQLAAILDQTPEKNPAIQSLKNTLVIQQFALNPQDIIHQKTLRYLYQQGLLSELQLAELDLVIQRHVPNYRSGKINGETFVNFLADALKQQKKRPRPWNIPYFWWALGLSLVALSLGSAMYFTKRGVLKDTFKIAKTEAARLNNLAVAYYTEEIPLNNVSATKDTLSSTYFGFNSISTTAGQFLDQAIIVDSVFKKAHENYQKLYYNDGLSHYQSFQENETYPLAKAKEPFKKAIYYKEFKDSTIYYSAMLALANIHNLLNEQDSVCQLLTNLAAITNPALQAKVQQLKKNAIYCATQPVEVKLTGKIVDANSLAGLADVNIKGEEITVQSSEAGSYQLIINKLPEQTELELTFNKSGYQSINKVIELKSAIIPIEIIRLLPRTSNEEVEIKGRIVNAQTGSGLPDISIGSTKTDKQGFFKYQLIPSTTDQTILTISIQVAGYEAYQKDIILSQTNNVFLQLIPKGRNVATEYNFPVPEMVLVAGGTFTMGCTPEQEFVCELDERPAHQVQLDSFEIGKYEVTNEQFAAFINDYGSTTIKTGVHTGQKIVIADGWGIQQGADGRWQPAEGYKNHPAVGMPQEGAAAYCTWLSQKTGQNWRLPTEAEWEYAARGGPNQVNYIFAGGDNLAAVAWCYSNSYEKGHGHPNYGTNPVGQRKPNTLGIYDMSGNVFEWCAGWYQKDAYATFEDKLAINPQAPTTGEKRILRGGSWHLYSKVDARVANRIHVPKETRGNISGFRCVRQ